MIRRTHWAAIIILLPLLSADRTAVFGAAPQNQIPSCYAFSKVGVSPPEVERALFVLIDQTTVLDAELKQALSDSVRSFLRPGTSFTVIRFSAFSQGRYLDIVSTGVLEQPIPQEVRNSISVKALKQFDSCVRGQVEFGAKMAFSSIEKIVIDSTSGLEKSDVMASLAEVSRIAKESKAPRRVVLAVSDMLENSSISSFYEKNGVRRIDPTKEMKVAEESKVIGDFGEASVYVMGAGLLADSTDGKSKGHSKSGYRDPKTMTALKQFWSSYFAKSNAKLEEFGMPALLSPVR